MNFANMPNQPNLPPMPQLFGQPAQQMAPAGEIVWVQSVDQLNALTLPPNASRIYMNSAEAEFYIVTTDKIGMKSVATYTFMEKPKPQPGDLQVIKQNLNDKMLQQFIAQARQQGISEDDINAGLRMLGYK